MTAVHDVELVKVESLKPHPKNYRSHPAEQLAHIKSSLEQHGVYRNIVIARDGTILAGHGVVTAAKELGIKELPVRRLDISPEDPAALKVLTADNELGRFAEDDDRMLTELLKGIRDEDSLGLLGTGFDDKQLAALLMVTRPASEIRDANAAGEWLGMPEYDADDGDQFKVIITFRTEADRSRFVKEKDLTIDKVVGVGSWSTRWPWTDREDSASVRFEG